MSMMSSSNNQPPPQQRALRRSCQFCRTRKIRCSGQDKCDACRERNLDCIYGREGVKGRPRREKATSDPTGSGSLTPSITSFSSHRTSRSMHMQGMELDLSSIMPNMDMQYAMAMGGSTGRMDFGRIGTPVDMDEGVSLATELEMIFQQNFNPAMRSDSRNMYQEAVANFEAENGDAVGATSRGHSPFSLHEEDENMGQMDNNELKNAIMSYDSVLALLTQELVEMVAVKYGVLGCHHLGDTAATFYIRSLANDKTPRLMPDRIPQHNPFVDFDAHRTIQMIEIWFAVHPLSTIVSKTLLLRQFRSGTHDELLLALIVADALYIGDGARISNVEGEAFFDYAISLLSTVSVNKCNLSTAQALTLLGWHELCLAKTRRSTVFLTYACRIVSKMLTRASDELSAEDSRINGIASGDVELELMKNIYWLVLSMTLWSYMQFDQPFNDLMPPPHTLGFPPVEQTQSMAYKLDLVSGNISTLQRQARMVRELWALSHITSTVGHIYSLFPRSTKPTNTIQSWHDHSFQRLAEVGNPRQEMILLAQHIRANLLESVKEISPTRIPSPASRATVASAYHTLIIHLLFPLITASGGSPDYLSSSAFSVPLDVLETFMASARALVDIAKDFRQPVMSMMGSSQLYGGLMQNAPLYGAGCAPSDPAFAMTANMFTLSLDAAARAIEFLLPRLSAHDSDRAIHVPALATLAQELHAITKIERLASGARRVRLVKKHLKSVRLRAISESCASSTTSPLELHDFNFDLFPHHHHDLSALSSPLGSLSPIAPPPTSAGSIPPSPISPPTSTATKQQPPTSAPNQHANTAHNYLYASLFSSAASQHFDHRPSPPSPSINHNNNFIPAQYHQIQHQGYVCVPPTHTYQFVTSGAFGGPEMSTPQSSTPLFSPQYGGGGSGGGGGGGGASALQRMLLAGGSGGGGGGGPKSETSGSVMGDEGLGSEYGLPGEDYMSMLGYGGGDQQQQQQQQQQSHQEEKGYSMGWDVEGRFGGLDM